MPAKKILIVAGEPSGDLHGSNLVKILKIERPDLEFVGLGGKLLKEAGVDIELDISRFALIGLTEVIKNIFTIEKVYRSLLEKIDAGGIDLAILIDYPGFNLRLARALKKRSIPVVYYISPQIWAWGRGRINTIKRCVKKIIVFFDFEKKLYESYGMDVVFVGHPLIDIAKSSVSRDEILNKYSLRDEATKIAILPGSRKMELSLILPAMISASKIIQKRIANCQFIIGRFKDFPNDLYEKHIKDSGLDIRISDGDNYNVLSASDFAIVASGTATLETTIIGTPYVLVYKSDLITAIAYRIVARIPYLGLANIIAGKEIVPELLQFEARPENIASHVIDILENPLKKETMVMALAKVRDSLGASGSYLRAAEAILPLLS